MSKKIWFGNASYARYLPAPATGMRRNNERYSEELQFQGGGKWVESSRGYSSRFEMNIPVSDWRDNDGIEAYERFQNGEWGDEPLHFVDPMLDGQNYFPANWASPGLASVGWKKIYDTTPTFSATNATAVSTYDFPAMQANYEITNTAGTMPTSPESVLTMIIPSDSRLHIGWTGSRTGTGCLSVQEILLDGSDGTLHNITPQSPTSAPSGTLSSIPGTTRKAVKIYFSRTSGAASSVTPVSLFATYSSNATVPKPSRHYPGKGHHGLSFSGDATPIDYIQSANGRSLVGAYFELVETEPYGGN